MLNNINNKSKYPPKSIELRNGYFFFKLFKLLLQLAKMLHRPSQQQVI